LQSARKIYKIIYGIITETCSRDVLMNPIVYNIIHITWEIPLKNKPKQSAMLNAACHIPGRLIENCSVTIGHWQFTDSPNSHMLSEIIINVVCCSWT
jgi:hypothetical protein